MDKTTHSKRIFIEDILKHLYSYEQSERQASIASMAGTLQISQDEAGVLITDMIEHQLVELSEGSFSLTPAGREYAVQIVRAHRLWERYLADETGYAEDNWHTQADRREHQLSAAEVEALAARLGHPTHDPHGDPIPGAGGDFVPHGGQPVATLDAGSWARIVHLEDEPPTIYAQLVAEGLYPGQEIQLTEKSTQRICFQADGQEHVLVPVIARNISVVPLPGSVATAAEPGERLSALGVGQTARVTSISPACRGPERRRFMDLGILPGTLVKAEMISPSGDPTAYLIRQSLIALRKEQAELITITREPVPASQAEEK
ncbi:MAG TPA: metal-dependent transcriptional regulator [Anaerolineae bacterium]|jgi:DtxR family Mn-dependent transcriptional regulator